MVRVNHCPEASRGTLFGFAEVAVGSCRQVAFEQHQARSSVSTLELGNSSLINHKPGASKGNMVSAEHLPKYAPLKISLLHYFIRSTTP